MFPFHNYYCCADYYYHGTTRGIYTITPGDLWEAISNLQIPNNERFERYLRDVVAGQPSAD
jgi:hypothetical protein